ncbi:hypothetical protein Bca52824_043813 [Brassica carinata]|uniref:tRNA (guanine(26)-N(2))-dimethyltransferase n=1 Tax=Brassica carinata TaxID=52824 RepID=A0A8X7S431_BRACI|nr:hypothetical protein Bca52824_043813 [Brassica carinata]
MTVRRAWGMGKSYRSKRNRAASRVAEKDSFEASKEGTPSENSEVCYSKYGSYPLRGKYCHEMALRILLASIESCGLV